MLTQAQFARAAPVLLPDVLLEYGEDLWFVAVRKDVPDPGRPYERRGPGFAAPEAAADAAIQFAMEQGLSVESRDAMIEQAHESLRWFEADKSGFEE